MKHILKTTIISLALVSTCFAMGDRIQSKTQNSADPSYASMKVKNPKNEQKGMGISPIMFKDLSENTHTLTDFDKILIVDFWATWCPPCVAEIPHFIELQKTHPDVQVIGVSTDHPRTLDTVKKFRREHDINYPITMYNNEWEDVFGKITSIPTTFIIDKNKNIVKKYVGYQDISVFESDLEAIRKK